jgi:vacuolar-type H+-ATPase subunit H
MNEQTEVLEKIISAVGDIEGLFARNASSDSIVREAKNTAEALLANFEEELSRREEENMALRRENAALKKRSGDVDDLQETIAGMSGQLEKIRLDFEKALRERNEAKEEVARLQELWRRFTEGE